MSIPRFQDFAMPIDSSRDEIIAFKFGGCIKNIGELMYYAATKYSNFNSKWLAEYPKLSIFRDAKSAEERFYLTSFFTAAEFLNVMRASLPRKNAAENSVDYGKLRQNVNPYNGSATNIELIARNLVNYDFVKKIYIYDAGFSQNDILYLTQLFGESSDKVVIYEKTFMSIMDEHPEITTIFNDDAGEVVGWVQKHDQGSPETKDKCFMISANPNIDQNYGKGDVIFRHQKFIDEMPDRFGASCQWWQMKYIPYFSNELHN